MRMLKGLLPLFIVLSLTACTATSTHESAGQYVDNTVITTRVKGELFDQLQLKSFEIRVKAYKGIVQLSGFVGNAATKTRAAKITSKVPGVKRVVNNLIVKS